MAAAAPSRSPATAPAPARRVAAATEPASTADQSSAIVNGSENVSRATYRNGIVAASAAGASRDASGRPVMRTATA